MQRERDQSRATDWWSKSKDPVGEPAADRLLDSHDKDNWRAQIEPLQPVWFSVNWTEIDRPCRPYSTAAGRMEKWEKERETERMTDSEPEQEALCARWQIGPSSGVNFHQAVFLFPAARGFFRWPSILRETFSAVISAVSLHPAFDIWYLSVSIRGRPLITDCLWKCFYLIPDGDSVNVLAVKDWTLSLSSWLPSVC